MNSNRKQATYQVDDNYFLHLHEVPDGVKYHCFGTEEKEQIASGIISWEQLNESPIRSVMASARVEAFQKIGLAGGKAAAVAPEMLDKLPGGRKFLMRLEREYGEEPKRKSIRFINSQYKDLFRIPDGGTVEVQYPDRRFSVKCEYVDDYHLRFGYDVFHICELAEMLERGSGTCHPEPLITAEQAAWDVGHKGFLAIQTCEDGFDYTLCDKTFHELDGGQIDNPEMSMNEVRDAVLVDQGWSRRSMTRIGYDFVMERMEARERLEMTEKRTSSLEILSGLKGASAAEADRPRQKEAER